MTTLVYKYGLRRPTANADLVDEQMRLAHRYQNRLIEIERARREAVRAVFSKRDEAIAPQLQAVEEIETALVESIAGIKAGRASTRSRSDTAEQRAHVAALRDRKREALTTLKTARAALEMNAETKAALATAEETAHAAIREARSTCGVFWGTYLRIEAAMDAARKMPLWSRGEPNDPRFRRWDGEGLIAVQVQSVRPCSSADLLTGTDTRIQVSLEPLPDGPVSRTKTTKRRGTMRLRIGSEGPGNRTPIWAEFPMLMHRPLPEESTITWAVVTRRRTADRDAYELHLTLALPEGASRTFGAREREERKGDGAVFVNYGWRKKDDGGRRVAYWRDDCGGEGEILMDPAVLSGLRKVEDLQSIRSQHMDAMRTALSEWLKTNKDTLPDWLREETEFLHQWRSPGRFVGLCRKWSVQRFDGDAEGLELLVAWERGVWREELNRMDGGDRHLWQWQEHQRSKSLGRRKDHYRRIAADLARRYAVLVVEKFDLCDTQRHKPVESEEVEIAAARLQQKDAAISELRGCMIQAFTARGGRVVKVESHLDTQRCFECGCEERWDAARTVEHTCTGCDRTWDQDANNVKNIERKFKEFIQRERSDGEGIPAAKTLAKWAKKGRHNGTARKDGGKHTESLNGEVVA